MCNFFSLNVSSIIFPGLRQIDDKYVENCNKCLGYLMGMKENDVSYPETFFNAIDIIYRFLALNSRDYKDTELFNYTKAGYKISAASYFDPANDSKIFSDIKIPPLQEEIIYSLRTIYRPYIYDIISYETEVLLFFENYILDPEKYFERENIDADLDLISNQLKDDRPKQALTIADLKSKYLITPSSERLPKKTKIV